MSAKFAAVPAVLSAAALLASPLQAAPMAPFGDDRADAVAALEQGTSYHRYYRYRRGPDVGDVLTGVLIVGGIAVAADAIGKAMRDDDRYRDRSAPPPPYPRDDRRADPYRYDTARGIDRAVRMCVDAVERDSRVETVERVDRTADGWRVEGKLAGGKGFTCSLGQDGRIGSVDVDGRRLETEGRGWDDRDHSWRGADRDRAWRRTDREPQYGDRGSDQAEGDRQYDDERYAQAWSRQDADPEASAPGADAAQPEYPGGPIPGEDPADAPEAPTT